MLDDKEFKRRLKAAFDNWHKDSVKGIRLATAFIKLETQKLVPVDEGNLKASAYTSVNATKKEVIGEIGFTAEYALYVHEAPMTLKGQPRPGKGKFWDPQGSATNKFLQKTLDNNRPTILEIFRKALRL